MADEQDYYLGIDLGTTNSVVSWGRMVRRTGMFEPEVLPVDQIGAGKKSIRVSLLPSVVYFEDGSSPIVGEFAKTDAFTSQPQRVVRSVKSRMGNGEPMLIGRTQFSAARISSLILNQLRSALKDKFGAEVNDVVITVPASFDADMRADTIEAARLAGFKVTNQDGSARDILLDEPRAALHYLIYLQRIDEIPASIIDLSTKKTVLIFDLGGGTLDVSLHRVQADYDALDVDVEDIAISRYTRIGGDNFDELLSSFFQKEFETKYRLDIDSIPEEHIRHEIKSRFLLEAESKKRELNDAFKNGKTQGATLEMMRDLITSKIQLPNLFDNKPYWRDKFKWGELESIVSPLLGANLSIKDVERFEELSGEDANNIIYPILDVLHKAKQREGSIPQIDAVFLNGGMTRFIPVQRRLESFFGKQPFTLLDPDVSVAQGAALYHYSLHKGLKPKSVILAESVGIEINGGYVKRLIPAGTVLPMPRPISIEGLTIPEGTSQLTIPFYRGEIKEPKFPNVKLLERVIKLPHTCRKDEALLAEVSVDANKILTFRGHLVSEPEVEFEIKVESAHVSNSEVNTKPIRRVVVHPETETELDVEFFVDRLFSSSALTDGALKQGVEKEILSAKNRADFIGPISDNILKTYPKEILLKKVPYRRAFLMLGSLAQEFPENPGNQQAFNALHKVCLNTIKIQADNDEYIKQIIPMAVVALGRLKNPAAEGRFLQLLKEDIPYSVKEPVLVSLAKVSRSANALAAAAEFLVGKEILLRKSASWALGKMGSRDLEPPLPISKLKKPLDDLLYQVEREQDSATLHMMAYAISELCDQRNPSRREVFSGEIVVQARQMLEKIQVKIESRNKLTQPDQALKASLKMGLDMLYGRQLAKEQEKVLLSLRSKLDDDKA